MNVTESYAESSVKEYPMNEVVWKQKYKYLVKKIAFVMTAIIPNVLSFHETILMNVLVIMAYKTRPRLQSKYNNFLAFFCGNRPVSRSGFMKHEVKNPINDASADTLPTHCRHTADKTTDTIPIHVVRHTASASADAL